MTQGEKVLVMAKKNKRKLQYEANKSAKVGTEITCPICGTKFIKRQYSQHFVVVNVKMDIGMLKGIGTELVTIKSTITSIPKES